MLVFIQVFHCVCLSETQAVYYIDRTPAAVVTRMSVCTGELHKYILESELILNEGITQGMILLGQSDLASSIFSAPCLSVSHPLEPTVCLYSKAMLTRKLVP